MRVHRTPRPIVWVLLGLGLALSALPRPDGSSDGPSSGGRGSGEAWIVKLSEGRGLVLDDQARLWDPEGNEVRGWTGLGTRFPGLQVERLFPRPRAELVADRREGERRSGRTLRDLSLYARMTLPAGSGSALGQELRAALGDAGWLETAYPEPRAVPASIEESVIGNDSGGSGDEGRAPSFAHGQGYLGPAPDGIGALAVHPYPGGRGGSVRIVDIEGDWNWHHRDLPRPFVEEGTTLPAWRNHGTAVMGQLVGQDDGHGIIGICPEAEVGSVSFLDYGVAAAIDLASSSIAEGDIILIELHAPGPAEPEGPGQHGYLPMEWWQDCFDAIALATANGRIVVEAAGNGAQDLDHPRYLGMFDRRVRSSGAILVAAGTPWGREAEWFTNRGTRIDLHGWGSAIVTTGYGTLWGEDDEAESYTAGFGGTSGAAPIVVGALANLQSMCRHLWNVGLDPGLATELLRATGTPGAPGARIGPRPDLVRARRALVQGIGEVRGRVLGPEGEPIPAATVRALPGTRFVTTDGEGAFRIAVRAGVAGLEGLEGMEGLTDEDEGPGDARSLFVEADGFAATDVPLDLNAGESHRLDLTLAELPHSMVRGLVMTEDGVPVAGVEVQAVRLLGADPERTYRSMTDAAGTYEFVRLPANMDYWIVAGPSPSRTGAVRRLPLPPTAPEIVNVPDLVPGPAESFGGGAAGWTGEPPWRLDEDGAFSGDLGWSLGTGLYGEDIDVTLVSPPVSIPHNAWLSFHHRYDCEYGYDGGRVEIEFDGNWIPRTPLGGYDVPNVAALEWSAGFSGTSQGWRIGLVDLTEFEGSEVRIRFRFASDESISGRGWCIDDFGLISLPELPASLPGEEPGWPGGPSTGTSRRAAQEIHAYPNPFRDQVELRIVPTRTSGEANGIEPARSARAERIEPGDGGIDIIDSMGRRVRRLRVQEGVVVWDGKDRSGRNVPSGVFWIVPREAEHRSGATEDGLLAGRAPRFIHPLKLLRLR